MIDDVTGNGHGAPPNSNNSSQTSTGNGHSSNGHAGGAHEGAHDGPADALETELIEDLGDGSEAGHAKAEVGPEEFNKAIADLAKLPLGRYVQRRRAAARMLDCPAAMLDKLVKYERGANAPPDPASIGQGMPVEFPDLEPWPAPVEGETLLNDLAAAVHRHVILDPAVGRGAALWVVFTHVFDVAICGPKLIVTSKTKRSGKTRLLEVLDYVVPRPLPTANLSAAALFRVIPPDRPPTLLIDEADTFLAKDEELRGIINSGFTPTTARALRTVPIGDGWETRWFSTWCPQVIAAIGALPDTIVDRSINLVLQRKLKSERVEPLFQAGGAPLRELGRKAARWANDHRDEIAPRLRVRPELPELNDRAADGWWPLVVIADVAGGAWPDWARSAAKVLAGAVEDDTRVTMLLSDLRDLFYPPPSDERQPRPKPVDVLFSRDIAEALAQLEDRPWGAYGRTEKPITPHAIARMLRGLVKETSKTTKWAGRIDRGYRRTWFDDAFARYLPEREPG
jgi:hypothetical protein